MGEVVCHECGARYARPVLRPGEVAECTRCGSALLRRPKARLETSLALTLAGLVLFVVANAFPFLGLQIGAEHTEMTLVIAVQQLWADGRPDLAAVVAVTTLIAPALQLLLLLYLLVPLSMNRTPRDLPQVFSLITRLGPWSMMDVFMLGILVAAIKLADMATLVVGPALIAFLCLIFALAWAQAALDRQAIWERVPVTLARDSDEISGEPLECHTCHLAIAPPETRPKGYLRCPRCLTSLHHRKPQALGRAWALLIAAMICYVPANVLPIMHTSTLTGNQSDTIMSGVLFLLHHGMWPIALVIFIASVFVPLLKIIVLAYLLLSVQLKVKARPRDRTRLYRMTEGIGRWSMIDVYVVAILVALVHLGNLATVNAGLGAAFFAAVVILTMIAAHSFDPRLIWDVVDGHEHA